MKYKLINKQIGEEHLCEKVVMDGFDYYTEDGNVVKPVNFSKYQYQKGNGIFKGMDNMKQGEVYEVIATNNPNIDVPKIVDEVEMMALLQYPYPLDVKDKNDKIIQTKGEKPFNHAKIEKYRRAFVIGYNKSQETHPYSEEDMIELIRFITHEFNVDSFQNRRYRDSKHYATKELLQIWKEQKPKIVYYG